jgi:hypothetical protein
MVLASAPNQLVESLLPQAASTPQAELWKAVAQAREEVVHYAPGSAFLEDDKRLADVEAKLAKVRAISLVGLAHLERIRDQVLTLLSQDATDPLPAASAADPQPLTAPQNTSHVEHTLTRHQGRPPAVRAVSNS